MQKDKIYFIWLCYLTSLSQIDNFSLDRRGRPYDVHQASDAPKVQTGRGSVHSRLKGRSAQVRRIELWEYF